MRTSKSSRLLAELSLLGLTLVVALNSDRFLNSDTIVSQLTTVVLGVQLVLIALRWTRIPTWVSTIAAVITFFWLEMILLFKETLYLFLPTFSSLDELGNTISDGSDLFFGQKLPLEGGEGLQVLFAALMVPVLILVDWSAFRYVKASETVIPYLGLFLLFLYTGEKQDSILDAAIFLGVMSVFVLSHRTAFSPERKALYQKAPKSKSWNSQFKVGVPIAILAILLSVALGPIIPGSRADALLQIGSGSGGGDNSRLLFNPLVDIRGNLVDNPDVELFRVNSEINSYWRLAALDSFDGNVWSHQGQYNEAEGKLASTPGDSNILLVNQEFEIKALATGWVPVAYRPISISANSENAELDSEPSGEGAEFRYDNNTSTIITRRSSLFEGYKYTVTSVVPSITGAQIDALSEESIPNDVLNSNIDLPVNFSTSIRALAQELTASGQTSYQKALLLQNWFRSNYEYSVNIPSGHTKNRLEQFLFEDRVGYCEQFAAAYSVLARSIGIPARVAVGFTSGERLADGSPIVSVRGEYAHAWPEVYLPGVGWTPFEPTPSRGIPGAASYTGVPGLQGLAGDAAGTEPLLQNPSQTQTETDSIAPIEPPLPGLQAPPASPGATLPDTPVVEQSSDTNLVYLILLLCLGVFLLSYLAAVNIFRHKSVASLIHKNPDSRASTLLIWNLVYRDVLKHGITKAPSETPQEFSKRASQKLQFQTQDFKSLADSTSIALYAAKPPDSSLLAQNIETGERLHRELLARLPQKQKLISWFSPRPILNSIKNRAASRA